MHKMQILFSLWEFFLLLVYIASINNCKPAWPTLGGYRPRH